MTPPLSFTAQHLLAAPGLLWRAEQADGKNEAKPEPAGTSESVSPPLTNNNLVSASFLLPKSHTASFLAELNPESDRERNSKREFPVESSSTPFPVDLSIPCKLDT